MKELLPILAKSHHLVYANRTNFASFTHPIYTLLILLMLPILPIQHISLILTTLPIVN